MTNPIIRLPADPANVTISGPSGGFGELLSTELSPQVQLDPIFGLRSATDVDVFSSLSGTATAEYTGSGMEWKATAANSQYSYGLIRSRRNVRYRPGQGVSYRFTARYSEAVAGNTQRAGAFNTGSELTIGYNTNQQFGVMRRYGGQLQIVTLTLSAPAGGAETVTVTLNNAVFAVPVTATVLATNAYTLATFAYAGWNAYQNGSTVTFVSTTTGAKSGTYSISSTGTLAGSFAQTAVGATETDVWTYQSQWNIDKLDGTGESGITIDPTKGNVFQIQHQYLGYGTTTYSLINPKTGKFIPFHRIQYPNSNVSPNLSMPIMKIGYFSYNESGSTGTSIYGGSMSGFSDGWHVQVRNPDGYIKSQAAIGTTFSTIFSLRVRPTFNNIINLTEVLPKSVFIAAEGVKPSEVLVVLNGTFTGTPNWGYIKEASSTVEVNSISRTYTEGTGSIVAAIPLQKSGSSNVNLHDLDIRLQREDVISIVARATSGTVDVTGALVWHED